MKVGGRGFARGVAVALAVVTVLAAGTVRGAAAGRTLTAADIAANDLGPDNFQAKHLS